MLTKVHSNANPIPDCGYCKGTRSIMDYNGEVHVEHGLKYRSFGFTSNKMRVDDYEELINRGFSRCGCYFYQRDPLVSCCECYQYRVDHN